MGADVQEEARRRPRPKAGGPVLGAAEAAVGLAGFGVRYPARGAAPWAGGAPNARPRPASFAGPGWCRD